MFEFYVMSLEKNPNIWANPVNRFIVILLL